MTTAKQYITAATASLLFTLAATSRSAPAWINPAWAGDPVWADGRAEVCTYESTRTVHGKPRPHESIGIVAAEELDPARMVRTPDPAPGATLPALKFVWIADRIETDNYPHDFAVNVFVDRSDPSRVLRAVATNHDWTGLSFHEIQGWKRPPVLRSYSPASGHGSIEKTLPGGAIPLESLPLMLRAFDGRARAQFAVSGPLTAVRTPQASTVVATAAVVSTQTITVPAGQFECRQVDVEPAGGFGDPIMTLWIEAAAPNRLIRIIGPGPTESALKSCERRAYWEGVHIAPDEESEADEESQ